MFKMMKAWPVLLLLAAAYWVKKELGFNSGEEFSKELNAASQDILDFAVVVFFIALLWFLSSLLRRKKDKKSAKPQLSSPVSKA